MFLQQSNWIKLLFLTVIKEILKSEITTETK